MFEPIEFESDKLLVHGFRTQDVQALEMIAADVFNILSDESTLKFLPQKRLASIDEAVQLLRSNVLSFYAKKNYLHLVQVKSTGKVIGMIDLISPQVAKEHYRLAGRYPYFIELCLKSSESQQHVMSRLLPAFLEKLQAQRITNVAAIVNRRNEAARKVLERSGFICVGEFDILQDLYRLNKPAVIIAK